MKTRVMEAVSDLGDTVYRVYRWVDNRWSYVTSEPAIENAQRLAEKLAAVSETPEKLMAEYGE